jgi:hypothetical protein
MGIGDAVARAVKAIKTSRPIAFFPKSALTYTPNDYDDTLCVPAMNQGLMRVNYLPN